MAGRQIVYYTHARAFGRKSGRNVRADETGSTGDKYDSRKTHMISSN
jgi:hypothetical protein